MKTILDRVKYALEVLFIGTMTEGDLISEPVIRGNEMFFWRRKDGVWSYVQVFADADTGNLKLYSDGVRKDEAITESGCICGPKLFCMSGPNDSQKRRAKSSSAPHRPV